MLFSILIAHYNNASFLATALDSVLAQEYADWEVILIDDGSTDHFESVIQNYSEEQRIKVFRNLSNFGCGFTKRKCASLANGEIIGFLDPDDALHPVALAVMVKAHEEHPECSLIHSTHFVCNEQLQIGRIAEYIRALPVDVPYLLLGDASIHLFATFTKRAYGQTVGINADNKKAVDKDLYYRLEEVGSVLFINQPLYYYRIHKGSISNLGQEASATLIHYDVAKAACVRRIKRLKQDRLPGHKGLVRKYRARYYKLSILQSFKTRNWPRFVHCALLYPFVGGLKNVISYAKKLPVQGTALLRKSFVEHYKIKI